MILYLLLFLNRSFRFAGDSTLSRTLLAKKREAVFSVDGGDLVSRSRESQASGVGLAMTGHRLPRGLWWGCRLPLHVLPTWKVQHRHLRGEWRAWLLQSHLSVGFCAHPGLSPCGTDCLVAWCDVYSQLQNLRFIFKVVFCARVIMES